MIYALLKKFGLQRRKFFIKEHIKMEQVNIWALMQEVWLQTWSASLKMYM